MFHPSQRAVLARKYHKDLPADIRRYLNGRGIPDWLIEQKQLGWSGSRIVIPVFDSEGGICQFRYAKSPHDTSASPKMLSELGTGAELYGWERLVRRPRRIVICEGEFDRLVLEARGFEAVTSTAGAQSFRPEWALAFAGIRHVFICFDRDAAGVTAARYVKSLLPAAKIVHLPPEVGHKGDISDFFVRLGRDRADFEIVLAEAAAAAEPEDDDGAPSVSAKPPPGGQPHLRARRIRQAIRLVQVIGRFIDLTNIGRRFVGRCTFHEDDRPSFTIYPETDTYYCFGCGAHGDVVTFVMQKESKTYYEALDALERFELSHEL
jgi:hypothetical protein